MLTIKADEQAAPNEPPASEAEAAWAARRKGQTELATAKGVL